MKKNIIFIIIIIVVFISGFFIGKYSNNSNTDTIKKETNNSKEEIKNKSEIEKKLEDLGYKKNGKNDLIYDKEYFTDLKLIVGELYIHNNGDIWKFNANQVYSNEMNSMKMNQKIEEKILVGLKSNEGNGIYYFITENFDIIKIDSINDTKESVDEMNSHAIFRPEELLGALKKELPDIIFNSSNDYFRCIKDNKIYNYNYTYIYEGEYIDGQKQAYNVYQEKNLIKCNSEIDFSTEKFIGTVGNCLITDKNIYQYGILNEEESNKYAEIEPIYGYYKIDISEYYDKIEGVSGSTILVEGNKYYHP
ncbi:MAG: hypothetical protein ACI4VE_05935 [Clostridia bacterium]